MRVLPCRSRTGKKRTSARGEKKEENGAPTQPGWLNGRCAKAAQSPQAHLAAGKAELHRSERRCTRALKQNARAGVGRSNSPPVDRIRHDSRTDPRSCPSLLSKGEDDKAAATGALGFVLPFDWNGSKRPSEPSAHSC
ncbi:hypothetical protein L1887_55631 [Cichorium endivia]|nr:hypothetical protein L1887_55631 [Cichorium endivia]